MVLWAVLGGFVLDALFGDPAWLPHPVVLMGRCISRLEKFLRARLPGTPQGELLGGAVTAFCLPVGTFLVTSLVCLAAAHGFAGSGQVVPDQLVIHICALLCKASGCQRLPAPEHLHGKAQPVAGPCGADVLVRAGAGGKGPCAGEHKCV